jgi:hypothetical protein
MFRSESVVQLLRRRLGHYLLRKKMVEERIQEHRDGAPVK